MTILQNSIFQIYTQILPYGYIYSNIMWTTPVYVAPMTVWEPWPQQLILPLTEPKSSNKQVRVHGNYTLSDCYSIVCGRF